MDEQPQETINTEEATLPAAPSPTNQEEQQPIEAEPKLEITEETPEPTAVKPVEKRIHKLVDERDRERERAESLALQVEQLTAQLGQPQAQPDFAPQIELGQEVTPEQYKADVTRQAQAITQMELHKERIINRVNREAGEAIQTHPELDPNSEVFDKELSDTITDSVKAQIQVNPNASVKRLVDQMMKPYRKAVQKQVAEQTETITKQVSETALRPSTVQVAEKPFEELSIEEMEAKLGKVY